VRGAGASAALAVISAAVDLSDRGNREECFQSDLGADVYQAGSRTHAEFVERAEAAGCQALCVTVDDPVTGIRDSIWRAESTAPNIKSVNRTGITSKKYGPPGDKYSPIPRQTDLGRR